MRFNVAQFLQEGVGFRQTHSLNETVESLQDSGTTWVRGELVLTRVDRGIWVNGRVEANAAAVCSRCLNPAELEVRFRMDDEYLPTVAIDTGAPLPEPEDAEGGFSLDEYHNLDLTEAVRQYITISLPMKPLCSQSCAGLCSGCGANLNNGPCGCAGARDSRWGPLVDLIATEGSG